MFVLSSDSEEEILFERQLISLAMDLKIPINNESSSEDIEFISSYLTFIKFARVFAPEPGSFLSAYSHKSGECLKNAYKIRHCLSLCSWFSFPKEGRKNL